MKKYIFVSISTLSTDSLSPPIKHSLTLPHYAVLIILVTAVHETASITWNSTFCNMVHSEESQTKKRDRQTR